MSHLYDRKEISIHSYTSLYNQAIDMATKKGDARLLATIEILSLRLSIRNRFLIQTITEAGEYIETTNAKASDQLKNVLVMIDNNLHYLYSIEAWPFRQNCFALHFKASEKAMYYLYLLSRLHVRNSMTLCQSNRYIIVK